MAGYQFTPFGIVPLGAPIPAASDEPSFVGGRAEPTARVEPTSARAATPQPPTFDPTKPMTGRDLMKAAKARVKEIDRILRGMPGLQAERAQLASLIVAASPSRQPKGAPRGH